MAAEINDLVEKELKIPPPEPKCAIAVRAFIRPLITLSLTLVLCLLIVWYATNTDPAKVEHLKNAVTIFLGIYGPIIGFWFGEKTALKVPGEQK